MKRFFNISYKIFITIIIIALIFFIMSNSFTSQNIDKIAYVVALGIDIGANDNIILSIQLAKPSSMSSSSSTQSSSSVVNSVECSSIADGINLFNSYISRNINLSHCKIIAISEKLSCQGISKYLYDLSNNVEVSSHANIIVTKCDANDYLKMTSPTLENFPARYYEIVNTASNITGYTSAPSLIDFFDCYMDTMQNPIAVLANINTKETHLDDISRKYC